MTGVVIQLLKEITLEKTMETLLELRINKEVYYLVAQKLLV